MKKDMGEDLGAIPIDMGEDIGAVPLQPLPGPAPTPTQFKEGSLLKTLIAPIKWATDTYTDYVGGPARTVVSEALKTPKGSLTRIKESFGDRSKAATSQDIASQLGLSQSSIIPEKLQPIAKQYLEARMSPMLGLIKLPDVVNLPGLFAEQLSKVSPSDIGGLGIDLAIDSAVTAPLTKGIQLTAGGAKQLSDKASEVISDIANRQAFKALKGFKPDVRRNIHRLDQIGEDVLESGALPKAVPKNTEALKEQVKEIKEEYGQKLGDLVETIYKTKYGGRIDRNDIAKKTFDKVKRNPDIPNGAKENDEIVSLLEPFLFTSDGINRKGPINLEELRKIKKSLDDRINWARVSKAPLGLKEEVNKALRQSIKEAEESLVDGFIQFKDRVIQEQILKMMNASSPLVKDSKDIKKEAEKIVEKVFGTKLSGLKMNDFQKLKRQYGSLDEAYDILDNRTTADIANLGIGLRDSFLGGLGAGAGSQYDKSFEGSILGILASKFLRGYGNQTAAIYLNHLANLVKKTPELEPYLERNPQMIPLLLEIGREEKPKTAAERKLQSLDRARSGFAYADEEPEMYPTYEPDRYQTGRVPKITQQEIDEMQALIDSERGLDVLRFKKNPLFDLKYYREFEKTLGR